MTLPNILRSKHLSRRVGKVFCFVGYKSNFMVVPAAKYEGGQPRRSQLETEAIDQSQIIREKVLSTVVVLHRTDRNLMYVIRLPQ